MAEAALSFALEKLTDLLIQKVDFLRGVKGQVEWLKGELKRMQSFLKDAAEKQAKKESIRNWISDIRDVAHDAEDAVETFILKVDTPRRSRGLLERCACFPNHVYHLDQLGQQIESIRGRLQDIENSRQRYEIQSLDDGVDFPRRDVVELRRLSPWQTDKHLVGLQEQAKLLLQKAVFEEKKGLSVASIVGMGGIGKSTLARFLYNHAEVANGFECHAWVCVSSEFSVKDIIKGLMLQLLHSDEEKKNVLEIIDRSPMERIKHMLYERLKGKRYLIVLDDVWREEDWESLASVFPDEKDKASTLLLTSRIRDIASAARYVHDMKTLDPNQSWQLFLHRVFIDSIDGKCPPELEDIGREIVKKCYGLPLALTVVAGLLVKQGQLKSGWEKVLKGLNSPHLGSSTSTVSDVLELSYLDLPPQLKSCFLCLGFFKEDATIPARMLFQVWIAEGLISPEGGDNQETINEIAANCLNELINRNMVQVEEMKLDGRVKTCYIHDLIRELSIRKAKEEIGFGIIRDPDQINPRESSDQKCRHLSVYCSNTQTHSISLSTRNKKHLRTLFFYGDDYSNFDFSPSNWENLGLLRVLHFQVGGLGEFPKSIGALIGLRFLGRSSSITELPRSLGRLKNLEVFDLKSFFGEVPSFIWKMESLRQFYMYRGYCRVPQKIDTPIRNLKTLEYIAGHDWMEEHLLIHMTSLSELGLHITEERELTKLFTSLAKLQNLMSLKMKMWVSTPSVDGLGFLHCLTKLKLKGMVNPAKLPNGSNFPPNLSHLSLTITELRGDKMQVLGKLPKLLYLKLSYSACWAPMVISHDGFPRLQVFYLRAPSNLRNIQVEKGAMPELKRLNIHECSTLESLPEELRLMTNLKELKIVCRRGTTCANMLPKEIKKFSNIPYIDLIITD